MSELLLVGGDGEDDEQIREGRRRWNFKMRGDEGDGRFATAIKDSN